MKTAVEWLREIYDSCNTYEKFIANIDWEQAKAMEKEQIMDAFEAAEKDCGRDFLHGDLYYNKIFKSE